MADPITLAILFGAGALAGFAGKSEVIEQSINRDIVIRPLFRWNSGWLAHELLSREALDAVGAMLDLDLMTFWPSVKSSFYKVVAITQVGGPVDRHIIAVLEGHGKYGWSLSEAYHHGYRRVQTKSQFQLIAELIDQLNTDPAKEVVKTAQGLPPGKRFIYLRQALTANPVLSAILAEDPGFKAMVMETVKTPEAQAIKAQIAQHRALPVEQRLLAPPSDLPTAMITGIPTGTDILDHYEAVRPQVIAIIQQGDVRLIRSMVSSVDTEINRRYHADGDMMPTTVPMEGAFPGHWMNPIHNLQQFLIDGLNDPQAGGIFYTALQKWAVDYGTKPWLIEIMMNSKILDEALKGFLRTHGEEAWAERIEKRPSRRRRRGNK